ncbi:DUF3013 family protein [Lactococcus termiticola]|uniref:DUF3013 domain-containing protein n=1 Tax=Lactococcus termiticola TaxID=2169526 RepID=A0A2R5HJR9_9LACT|nr:DUF3013 family protein [Lactococcus termiticola]GBG96908.1 hypothetical protein NtB2_01043 [Lactococcus termiticola]
MADYGFLDILNQQLDKNFSYDSEMNWDKRNFAVEVSFLLEAENPDGLALTDADGVESEENVLYEDAVLFYNPVKSKFEPEDYLAAIPYPPQGLSEEFLAYFVNFLQETADKGLDALMDFLADEEAEAFSLDFDREAFEAGRAKLNEAKFYKYPRY